MFFFKFFFIPLIILFSMQTEAATSYTDYDVKIVNGSVELNDLRLTSQELRWLNSKNNFIVAVDRTMHSALLQTEPGMLAEGINADYLGLLQQSLKVKVVLREYPSREDAVRALKEAEVDAMLTDLMSSRPDDPSINLSSPLITTFPVLVTSVNNTMSPLSTIKPVKIARVSDYPPRETILHSFPNATIIDYPNYYEALASVSSGENKYFIGSNIITSTLISRYFTHSLNAIKYYKCPCLRSFFLTQKDIKILPDIINRFIGSLSNEVRRDVIQTWLNVGNLGFANKELTLNPQEKNWMKNHPAVKVLVTSLHPPFSMTDENGAPRGIMGDLLNIIELQTGMKFIPVLDPGTPLGDVLHPEGHWDIFPGAIYSEEREKDVAFSKMLMMSPYVYVIPKGRMKDKNLRPAMKVGLPSYYGLNDILKKRHPDIEWVPVMNASAAFHQVKEGKLDALVATQSTARYMVDHYYPDTLDFFRIQDVPHAVITFAFPKNEPELKSIIDKALNNLPPSEIFRLTDKWTKMPNVKINTWDLYSQQFYIVTALAVSLILSSLLWGFYLLREVRRRRVVQGDLENQISFRKALSDSLPAPSYVVNSQGQIVRHNRAFSQYFTEEYYPIASLPLTDPHSPFFAMMAKFADMQLDEDGNRPVNTCELELNNGRVTRSIQHWLTLCDMPANDDRVFICGWEDITETRALISELEIEKNKAINASIAKSEFLANMSHEIRTPVSSIMGFLELLTNLEQTEEQKAEAIKLAYTTGQSLLELIGEILDVDKIESGKYQLQPKWLDMAEHLMVIYRAFHTLAARKKIQLFIDNSLSHHYLIMIDPQAIKQVLTNLLSNALKFTDSGSIRLNAKLITQDTATAKLIINVVDSGSGISKEEQKLLFKPYSQTHSGRQQTGSGLGLMICKQLVGKMRGQLSVESCPGIGSTFSVSIPVAVTPRECVVTEDSDQSCTLPANLHILVVDDHPTNRLLLKRQLSTLGYNVIEACDGEDALNKVSQHHFDLLITDINMPLLDGFKLTQVLRQQNKNLTIWGLTANAQNSERELGLSYGMDLCLFKPLTFDVLKTQLSKLTSQDPLVNVPQYLDMNLLKENTGDDRELMCEIVLTFRQASQEDLALAWQALNKGDKYAFKKHIHRLHGSAGILNLIRLRDICFQLESHPFTNSGSLTKTQLMQTLAEHLADLDHEIALFLGRMM